MVLVNYSTRELTAKLVYYGPGLCGKTTNLQYVYESLLPKDRRGKMVSLATETDRTLFFDFLPLELGTIRGLKTRLQLYTVPGQVHYNATRKIVLKGADGIVFVADSQTSKRDGNIESFRNMKANLAENGLDLRAIPHVIQLNKRDLPDVMSIEQMNEDLNEYNAPFFEATAIQGIGVEDTLKGISKLVLKNLAGRFQPGAEAPPAGAVEPAAAPPAPPPVESPAETVAAPLPPPQPVAPAAFTPAPLVLPTPLAAPAAAPSLAAPAAAPPFAAPPAAPAAAPFAAQAPASSGGLEDMLLGAPSMSAPLPAGSNDVFGVDSGAMPAQPPMPPMPALAAPTPAAPAPAAAGNLEDMLLAGGPMTSEPEIEIVDELELPTADEEALLRGDTVLSNDMMSPLSPLDGPSQPSAAAPVEMPSDMEAAMLSGDTMMSPMPGMPGAASAKDFEFDAALLSGDTVMSPSPFEPPRPLSEQGPALSAEPEPIALDAGDELPLSDDEAIPLSSDEMLGGGSADLESSLLASPPATPAAIDIPVPIHIGVAAAGAVVERVLRVPIQYTDAAGQHQTTLEVTLRFKLG